LKDIIIGTVLGDGYLEPHGRGVRLQIVHSSAQEAYIRWKYSKLISLLPSPMYYYRNGKYSFWRFITRSHPYLAELRKIFYIDGKKRIPDDIDKYLNNRLSLSVWFMDDGTCDKRQGSLLFETQCFCLQDIEKLQACIATNFNLNATIHKSGKGRGLRLYLSVKESRKFRKMVEPFILPEMKYKLPVSL
jgi:hypothetical protein